MKKGFTLIELLVVVLIIGILAAVALPKYQLAVNKTRTQTAIAWAEDILRAQELYFLANGEYADSLDKLDISYPARSAGYRPELSNGGFMVRIRPLNNQLPMIEFFGKQKLPHLGHLSNARHLIAGTEYPQKVARALGATQDSNYSYRWYLPSAS